MGWHALLRVVDFQDLLSSQATIAEALDRAQRAHGARSDEARSLREGFQLVAKVLLTGRASVPQVHDLAWLDHTVVSAGARLGKTYQGEDARGAWASLADRAALADLLPSERSWTEIPAELFGGGEGLKLERGEARPFRVGIVNRAGLASLARDLAAEDAPSGEGGRSLLGDVAALVSAARRAGRGSTALVCAEASLGRLAGE